MADIYRKNGLTDAAYKLYQEYIKTLENKEDIENAERKLLQLGPANNPSMFTSNIFLYKKGSCLYTELKPSNNLYIILSGRVGIYNIVNGKLILEDVYKEHYVIDGYEPKSEYKPLLTTAIALEITYMKVVTKEEFIEMLMKDKQLRGYHIKMMSMKVINVLSKIKAIEEERNIFKLFIFLSGIIKIDTLFDGQNTIIIPYSIDDITNSIKLSKENILENIKKIKSIELIKDKYIKIIDINDFFSEYHKYQKNYY
uniref:cyclic nucleotide-binding domain-containing protein n=1 Tax=Brachyspira sp. TaxID=1977261 RepID=UPI00262DC754